MKFDFVRKQIEFGESFNLRNNPFSLFAQVCDVILA